DGINSIKSVIRELHLHKVALDKAEFVRQTIARSILGCTFDLVVVVVQTNYIGVCEPDDLTCRSTNTTANIQHFHTTLDAHAVSKVVFVAGNGLEEGLARSEATEMERSAPPILV